MKTSREALTIEAMSLAAFLEDYGVYNYDAMSDLELEELIRSRWATRNERLIAARLRKMRRQGWLAKDDSGASKSSLPSSGPKR